MLTVNHWYILAWSSGWWWYIILMVCTFYSNKCYWLPDPALICLMMLSGPFFGMISQALRLMASWRLNDGFIPSCFAMTCAVRKFGCYGAHLDHLSIWTISDGEKNGYAKSFYVLVNSDIMMSCCCCGWLPDKLIRGSFLIYYMGTFANQFPDTPSKMFAPTFTNEMTQL